MIKEAIILAGGLGTRLRSAVGELPKCMAPVNNIPFIAYLLGWLQQEGIEHFIFSLGYKHEAITAYLKGEFPFLQQSYQIEDSPLGTGGAIKLGLEAVHGNQALVVNGDTLFAVPLKTLSDFHHNNQSACSLSLKQLSQFDRYGKVILEADQVLGFEEKAFCENGLINGGVYALEINALANGFPEKFSFEQDFLQPAANRKKLSGIAFDAYFKDIGIPEDYHQFELDVLLKDHSPNHQNQLRWKSKEELNAWFNRVRHQLNSHA